MLGKNAFGCEQECGIGYPNQERIPLIKSGLALVGLTKSSIVFVHSNVLYLKHNPTKGLEVHCLEHRV